MKKFNVKVAIPQHFAGKTIVLEMRAKDVDDAKAQTVVAMLDWIIEVKKK